MKTKILGLLILALFTIGTSIHTTSLGKDFAFTNVLAISLIPSASAECIDIPKGWCDGYTKSTVNCYKDMGAGKPKQWCGIHDTCLKGGTTTTCSATACSAGCS